ncbi:Fpg/Nei family DNA glycosylase [Solicola gregarius]|uniref:DNA-(apurinic or apyrimidinic site) lyase n=1 Tax=Solicola gregarius TaxID=2908642 RepID=A0AA46TFB3_9ACTN|nr:DNA-formamidopyrimidine glycosylase family protein [Solicola gregarius]UYM04276.1 Fpg/Nei family DNA glycosylase [Solicola gregarius]
MPEGHTLHRLANALDDAFVGSRVRVSSPQGRFAESAGLLDGAEVVGCEAYGKHLFVDFDADRVIHVHLGLIGTFDLGSGPGGLPRGEVRLRIASPHAYADLRGPTACELWTCDQVEALTGRLGPDPLRDDADPDRAWRRIGRSRAPLATLLMDQSVIAGVGNVYRAELLFRHRLDPFMEGRLLRRREWQDIWDDLCALMGEGVKTGRIDTVRPEHEPEAMGREPRVDDHGGEVYVYRRTGAPCHVCGTRVRREVHASRNLFWCPRCQRRSRRRPK